MKSTSGALLLALSLISASLNARELPGTPGDLMDYFSWDARPLFVFSPIADDPKVDQLRQRWLATETQWQDRNMALVTTLGDSPVEINGKASALNPQAMRRFFTVKPDEFVIMLVGYDGEVKLRTRDDRVLQTVYELIDTMPMRRAEMATQGQATSPNDGGVK